MYDISRNVNCLSVRRTRRNAATSSSDMLLYLSILPVIIASEIAFGYNIIFYMRTKQAGAEHLKSGTCLRFLRIRGDADKIGCFI